VVEKNDIMFGDTIGSTPNPKQLTFNNAWPYNVKIKVEVWDEDGTNWLGMPNDPDFVDYLSGIQSLYPDGHPNTITLSGRTTLVATIIVTCNTPGLSWDCVTPTTPIPADADPVARQRDPIQCYECSTQDMTTLEPDYISQWEALTKRDMSYVEVSPQCQDVAAVPDQYLQNCEGVCLTSLWDRDQDFIFRTCVAVTQDCSDLESDPESGATYYCSSDSKGNDDQHLIEGVPLPQTHPDAQPMVRSMDIAEIPSIQCYECASKDLTEMPESFKTSWEALTLRPLSEVPVTDECQDVALKPDENLQSCEGVCLTGVWDQDEDFLYRTCIAGRSDCEGLEHGGDTASGAHYYCSAESKGNNDKHTLPLPESLREEISDNEIREPSQYDTDGWECYDGWAIDGRNIRVEQDISLDECKQVCMDTEDCINVEYGQTKRVRGDKSWCILGNTTILDAKNNIKRSLWNKNEKYLTTCQRV